MIDTETMRRLHWTNTIVMSRASATPQAGRTWHQIVTRTRTHIIHLRKEAILVTPEITAILVILVIPANGLETVVRAIASTITTERSPSEMEVWGIVPTIDTHTSNVSPPDTVNRLIPPRVIHYTIERSDRGDWNTPESVPPNANHLTAGVVEIKCALDFCDALSQLSSNLS